MKIRTGDRVKILTGKDRGKEGTVTRVILEKDRVIVEGMNVVKKHQRATGNVKQGGIIDREMPMHVSNVALIRHRRQADSHWLQSSRKRIQSPHR